MAAIWSEENKYKAWLEVEILADEAWSELGEIPKEDVAKIRANASFDVDRILEIEQQHATTLLPSHVPFLKVLVKNVNGFTMV